jgi:glycosyltransferase involved in cell wall biosynthesis
MSKVTVAIPCYNALPYLEDCLRSVLGQSHSDWEALVVDDASTEGDPARVIDALADSRIRLLRHGVNRGLAAARNTAFAAATAPLVLPLDGDDVLAPNFLSSLLAILEKDPSLDCAFTDFELFGARTGIRRMKAEPVSMLATGQWLPGAGVLMRRALWERAGKYCEDPVLRFGNEDWDFWLSAAETGFHAAHLPEPLYRYRQHAANMSSCALIKKDYVTRRFLVQRHQAFFAAHGDRRKFLAEGYWRPADDARCLGRPFQSLYLSLRALILDGNWRRFWALVRNNASALLSAKTREKFKSALGRVAPGDHQERTPAKLGFTRVATEKTNVQSLEK